MIIQEHWLSSARRCISPFHDQRPDPDDISLLVIHGISLPPERFGGPYIDQLFTGQLDYEADPYFAGLRDLQVSSHLLIRRDGNIVQYVPFDQRAWHAGKSVYQGRNRCNDFAIGIELEGTDHCPYLELQYQVLAKISAVLVNVYPRLGQEQPWGRIVGHQDIAPVRKTDPGPAFDWARYRCLLSHNLRHNKWS